MSRIKPGGPSPALVISVLALVVAMSGSAYAAFSLPRNSVGSRQLRRNAVTNAKIKRGAVTDRKIARGTITGDKIKLATLGTVPSANTAQNANDLGGLSASSYATAAQPGYTAATLDTGYSDYGDGYSTPGYLKDTLGFVHLTGTMNCPASGTAFTLPPGYRPAENLFAPIAVSGNGGTVEILTTGDVITFNNSKKATSCGLDGLVFKAA